MLFVSSQTVFSQKEKKSFLIVSSSKTYSAALKSAQSAANNSGIPMDLRNMYKDKEEGLTSSEVCGCGEAHGYIPRGRGDDGTYISIEYSSSFEGFKEGYYIVVAASGDKDKVALELNRVKKLNKSAYIKSTQVYTGCMH